MRTMTLFLLLIPILCIAADKGEKKRMELLKRIELLRREYAKEQTKLQQVTEERWEERQKQVTAKQNNKEDLDRLQQQMERMYSDVARAGEELLARQNALEHEQEILEQKRQERDFLVKAINAKSEKESEINLAGFPLNQDTRMAALKHIDNMFPAKRHTLSKVQALVTYSIQTLQESGELGIGRRTFISDGGEPITAQILRIGHCMAYAMTPDGEICFLGNTGSLKRNRFEWSMITNEDMIASLTESFPRWISERKIESDLPVDILQNKFSTTLIGGEPRTWKTVVKEFFQAGGPILIPLALIVLWALLLILNRIVVFTMKTSQGNRFMHDAIALLAAGEIEKAKKLAQNRKGVQARVLDTCLKQSKWKRIAAEKSIKELLLTEVPQLDKHLATLAVLAGAAPLLGLLGTVTGMIRMFEAITKFGTGDPKLLAGGISEALITTEVGLAIAIPLLLIHNFLRNRRNHIQSDMEMYAMRILNRLWPEE